MARSRLQSHLLRKRLLYDILFDPEKLDPSVVYLEDKSSVNMHFARLPEAQQEAYTAYFRRPSLLPILPLRIERLSEPPKAPLPLLQYRVKWEYDRQERKTEVKRLALTGFDIAKLGRTYYNYTQLRELRKAYEKGLDIEPLMNNRYDRFQLMALTYGMKEGFDVSSFADPSVPSRLMADYLHYMLEDRIVDMMLTKGLDKQMDRDDADIRELEGLEKRKSFAELLEDAQNREDVQEMKSSKVLQLPRRPGKNLQK